MELAHIAMGHHIDTRYAFNDRLLFPDESTFQRIDMYHSDVDNEPRPPRRRMEYLQALDVQGQAGQRGPLLRAVGRERAKVLKALNTPKLGDSLLKPDGTPWMSDLAQMAPKINWDDLTQTAGPAAGKLAQDRSVGRQGAHAERQAVRAHERPRQDAVRGDADLLQAAALRSGQDHAACPGHNVPSAGGVRPAGGSPHRAGSPKRHSTGTDGHLESTTAVTSVIRNSQPGRAVRRTPAEASILMPVHLHFDKDQTPPDWKKLAQ